MTDLAEKAGWTGGQGKPTARSRVETLRVLDLEDDTFKLETLGMEDNTVKLRLSDLKIGACPRRGGVRADHVKTLTELGGRWPPIVVSRTDHRIVDGIHRVAAAKALGHTFIVARLFDGSADDAYIASIKYNVEHGLPLTLAERKEGATHILRVQPSWSDRRIAAICGLSPVTLGTLRARLREAPGRVKDDSVGERRTGRDGRSRPVDTVAARRRVAEAIARAPESSLRKISAQVGSSPETVRSVRAELQSETHELDGHEWWRSDSALRSSDGGRQLVIWLARANINRDVWAAHLDSVPLSRVYDLAAEARRRGSAWNAFADELEFKSRHGKP
jgi:ParB-like chromosome segregation protein Spo0J